MLANDSDPDVGDSLTVVAVGNAVNGTVVLNGDGTITIQAGSATGSVSFQYTIDDGNGGTATATATLSAVLPAGAIVGTAATDVLTGTSAGNQIFGLAGNDILYGRGGADSLVGDVGNDILYVDADDLSTGWVGGGAGTDSLKLDTTQTTGLAVTLTTAMSIERAYGGGNDDAFIGSAMADALWLEGSGGNDTLIGGSGNDTVYGGTGADSLVGGAGNEIIYGVAGADSLLGGDGNDILYVDADDLASGLVGGGAGMDMLKLESGQTAALGVSLAAALSIERAYGGGNADGLDGSAMTGALWLEGGSGGDRLIGGTGNDAMYGLD